MISVSFGDFTEARCQLDETVDPDDDFCGIGLMLNGTPLIGLTYSEAVDIADRMKALVEAFQKFKREEFEPAMAEMEVADSQK